MFLARQSIGIIESDSEDSGFIVSYSKDEMESEGNFMAIGLVTTGFESVIARLSVRQRLCGDIDTATSTDLSDFGILDHCFSGQCSAANQQDWGVREVTLSGNQDSVTRINK